MLFRVLGARLRQHPNSLIEIELIPSRTRYFFAALSGQRQEFNDATVWATNLSGSEDDLGQFKISQHPVAGNFLGRQWDTVRRRLLENGAANAPAQEGLDGLQGLVGSDRRAALLDRRNEFDNITLADFMDALVTPGLADFPAQKARDFGGRAILRDVLGNEGLQQFIDPIGDDPLLRCPFLSSGIAPVQLGREDLLRSHAGLMKGDAPEDPDRVLAQTRSGPTSPIENDEYLATLWRNFHAKPWTTGVPVDHVGRRCWQRVDRVLGQFDTRHKRSSRQMPLPTLQIGSTRNEMMGTTVTLHLHWRKQNQRVMNAQPSASIAGLSISDNFQGEVKDTPPYCYFFFAAAFRASAMA